MEGITRIPLKLNLSGVSMAFQPGRGVEASVEFCLGLLPY